MAMSPEAKPTERLFEPNDTLDDYDLAEIAEFEDLRQTHNSALDSAIQDGIAAQTGAKTVALQTAMDNFARAIDESAIAKSTGLPARTLSAQYKGFIAEEYFKHTLKINALAQGVSDSSIGIYTNGVLPDGTTLTGIDMEVDITVWTREHPWCQPMRESDWQSKMHNKASTYADDLASKQYERVNFVGGKGQGVNDTVKANIGGRTIESDAITPEEATAMADDAKTQATKAYGKRAEKLEELHGVEVRNAIKAGAAAGFLFTTIREVAGFLRDSDGLTEERFVQGIESILCGTVEGGVRAGAINESVYLFSRILGKEVASSSAEAIPAMAAANVAVDFAKDLYKCFVTGTIDTDDLLCNTVENAFSSAAGFGGGWLAGQLGSQVAGQIGSQAFAQSAAAIASAKSAAATGAAIGSPLGPIGTVVGSVIGGLVIGICAHAIVGVADKDAQETYCALVEEINEHIELEGCERIYYFADTMSSLSEFRLSFKDLLPCYNLISDLKEYNLHKKAIRSIEEQLETSLDGLDDQMEHALRDIERRHQMQLDELRASFEEQRITMVDGYREAMNTYVANSYAQYAGSFEAMTKSADCLIEELRQRRSAHSYVLDYMRNRNEINAELNGLLHELVMDEEDRERLMPFIDKLNWYMGQDRLLVGRQYVSFEAMLALIDEVDAA